MKKKVNFATLFIALSLASTPTIANAGSVGDGVFDWPTDWPEKADHSQEKRQFGNTQTLKILKPENKIKKTKKK